MRMIVAIFVTGFAAIASAQSYKIQGPVVGIRQLKGEAKCYVAIKDPGNRYYSEGYHYVDDRQLCAMANAAYLTGSNVWAKGLVQGGEANELEVIELSKASASPYWPPYGRDSKSGD